MSFDLIQSTEAIKGIASIAEAKAGAASFSAVLMRNAVAAFIGSDYEANLTSVKGVDGWDKAKGTWSSAANLAKWLADGNKLPVPTTAKNAWVFNGEAVKFLDKSSLVTLASARDALNETTVVAVIRHWREHRKVRAAAADAAAAATDARLAAFLRSPQGIEEFPGEDVTSLQIELADKPARMGEVLTQGAILLAGEAELSAQREQLQIASDMVAQMIANMDALPGEMFERLAGAVAERQEMEAADAAAARIAEAADHVIDREVRKVA